MKMRILTGIVVLFTLTFSVMTLPTARADIVPIPGTTIETQWVPSGPASDTIQVNIYADTVTEYNALRAGQIELTDDPIPAPEIPIFCSPGTNFWCTPLSGSGACPSGPFAWFKGWSSVSVDTGSCIANFFTLLNMWSPNPPVVGPTIRWGFNGSTVTLNPYLATGARDLHVLGEVYDPLLRANPYDHTQIFSWMADSYGFVPAGSDAGLCPTGANECLKMSLRGDIFSHDGVQMTASDVKFSYLSLRGTGASEGSCLGTNNVVDVSFDPAILPTSLGGTEAVGQSETFYIVLSAPPSSMSCFEQVPILPQHVWASDATSPCTTSGSPQCTVNSTLLSGTPADPVINYRLMGSGPFKCVDLITGQIGGGCTQTAAGGPGTQSVDAGGKIILGRFGSGLTPSNLAYFRDNANYVQWQWADLDQNGVVDAFDLNSIESCFSATPPLTGACLHFDTPASTLTCNTSAGSCIGQNSGGDNDGRVGGLEGSEAFRWFGVSWTLAATCSGIATGIEPYPQSLHDDGSTYSTTYSQTPTFVLTADPASIDFVPHTVGTFTSTITALTVLGFTGTVSLPPPTVTPSVGPGTPTASVSRSSISCQDDTATLTVKIFNNTPYNTYTVSVTGTSSSGSSTVQVALQPPAFSISATPVSSIPHGSSSTSSVTVASLHSFTGSVKVTSAITAGPACSGAKCPSISPKSITLTLTASGSGSTQSFTLTISTISTTPIGTYTITITGTSTNSSNVPGQTRSTTVSVTVT